MSQTPTRRSFLCAAPLLLSAAGAPFAVETLRAQAAGSHAAAPFQLIAAADLARSKLALAAHPGNDTLFNPATVPVAIVLTTEEKKGAPEFEWHQGRDHIVQILDGTTRYEVGGTPGHARETRPGEWLAPESAGATAYTLHAGDTLIIPRGTPHRRTTANSVTFLLISTTGNAPGQ